MPQPRTPLKYYWDKARYHIGHYNNSLKGIATYCAIGVAAPFMMPNDQPQDLPQFEMDATDTTGGTLHYEYLNTRVDQLAERLQDIKRDQLELAKADLIGGDTNTIETRISYKKGFLHTELKGFYGQLMTNTAINEVQFAKLQSRLVNADLDLAPYDDGPIKDAGIDLSGLNPAAFQEMQKITYERHQSDLDHAEEAEKAMRDVSDPKAYKIKYTSDSLAGWMMLMSLGGTGLYFGINSATARIRRAPKPKRKNYIKKKPSH